MMNLVCFTEERSAKEMLQIIIPKILPANYNLHHIIAFDGKQDLEKQIKLKLKNWQLPNTKFLIIRDQDSGDCITIKKELLEKVEFSGKQDVSLVRIACRELESFYLGDLLAIETGLNIKKLSKQQNKEKYRTPDTLPNAKKELQRIAKNYCQISGSRAISHHLKLNGSNKSTSFNFLISGIQKLCSTEP